MAEIATAIPASFVRGDTVSWRVSLDDYPADDGWVLSYALVKDGEQKTVTATADGSAHLATITAATSATYGVGLFAWQAYVTKAPDRYTVGSGLLEVCRNFAEESSGFDTRSTNRKILEALEATLAGRATKHHANYSVETGGGSRSVTSLTHSELISAIEKFRGLVAAEDRLANGQTGSRGRIHARFT